MELAVQENQAQSHVNAHLMGRPASRTQLNTPALVLDLDAFDRNLEKMAAHCSKEGIALRPHTKTHKSVIIADAQVKAGAVGICCAKLGEAEAMADGGLQNILLTSPVVTGEAIKRLIALNGQISDLMVVVDNADNVNALAEAADASGGQLKVLVDLDIGLHRTGIAPGDPAVELAALACSHDSLLFMGLQAYAGHVMHIDDFAERREKSLEGMRMLAETRDALEARGVLCSILTGGGTGTFDIDPEANVLTELQGGSYIFMDHQYNVVKAANDGPTPFETALFVQMSVISTNTRGIVTTDAGFKSFSTDADPPVLASGAPEGTSYFYFGDEQGGLSLPDKEAPLPIGSVVTAIAPHCDPTVNLYDAYHCVRGDTLVDIWPIEARGRSA